jgi:Flp pilus assembly protein TadG
VRTTLNRKGRAWHNAGQVLPLFAIVVTALLLMAALLFDAGDALVLKRRLQDGADSAALAGVQQIASTGCSTSVGGPPFAFVTQAVTNSLRANLPSLDLSRVSVTCPSNWPNSAVRVAVWDKAGSFFGPIAGLDGIRVSVTATAVNGVISSTRLPAAIVTQPYAGSGSAQGCPSFSISGSRRHLSLYLEADLVVNSSCPATSGGAATIGYNDVAYSNSAQLKAAGDIVTSGGAPNANALSRQSGIADPLAVLAEPDISRLPVRSTSKLAVRGVQVLLPGVYRGGIDVSGIALLEPGVYYIDGGGLKVNGGGSLYTVNSGVILTTPLTWSNDCLVGRCGALIFNRVSSNSDDFFIRGEVRMRPLDTTAVAAGGYAPSEYNKIGYWQSRSPVDQPNVDFGGSGYLYLDGVVYAPSAQFRVWGSSDADIYEFRSQFIVQQLALGGSSTTTLHSPVAGFTSTVDDYGLVE